jgi:hypothetical protein
MNRLRYFLAFALLITAFLAGSFIALSRLDAATVCPTFLGCTGTSTAPKYGQLLVGDGAGNYTFTSTSSLGVTGTFATTSADFWKSQRNFPTTTLLTDSNTFSGKTTLATTTASVLNDTIFITGWPYAMTDVGIRTAFAVASSSGGKYKTVQLIPGTYQMAAWPDVSGNIDFAGAGKQRTFLVDNSGGVLARFLTLNKQNNVSIHDMSFVGNGSVPPTGIGPADAIDDNGSSNVKLYNLSFSHFDDAAINVQESGTVAASSTEIYGIDADCTVGAPIFVSDDITTTYANNTRIHDNNLCGNDSAIAVFNSTSTKIWANNIDKRGTIAGQGIELGSSGALSHVRDVEAWNNTVVGAPANGILVSGTTTSGFVSGNDVSYSTLNGFSISGSLVAVTGNHAFNNKQDGFRIIAGNSAVVVRPMIIANFAYDNGQSGNGYCGIEVNSQSSGSIVGAQITDNHLFDDQATPTQTWGLCFDNTGAENDGQQINGNVFSGNPQAIQFGTTHSWTPGAKLNQIFNNPGSTSSIDYFSINGSASTTLLSANTAFSGNSTRHQRQPLPQWPGLSL